MKSKIEIAAMPTLEKQTQRHTVEYAPASPATARRIPALDFTKGALVLIMVLYHWLNYFYSAPGDVYKYLRFLTPSFIFIAGFLVSNVYLSKYSVSDSRLPRRLCWRGLKILGVFAALNLARTIMVPRASRDQLFAQHSSLKSLLDIYVIGANLGGGQAKAVAFYVLVPIAYLLVLSSLLVLLTRVYRYAFHAMFAAFLLCVLLLDTYGTASSNLQLITIGILGVVAGYVPIERITKLVRHPFLLLASYAGYLAAITFWNVVYPLQIVGVCLSLMVIYLVGDAGGNRQNKVYEVVVLLGKYSLVGYIVQIAVLQALHQGIRHFDVDVQNNVALVASFLAASVLTILSVAATDWARHRSTAVNRIYGTVFA
jgi:peptidoglycan/LPS O-acetylase OafA/YrhL